MLRRSELTFFIENGRTVGTKHAEASLHYKPVDNRNVTTQESEKILRASSLVLGEGGEIYTK